MSDKKTRIFSYSRVSSSTQQIESQEQQLDAYIRSREDWDLVEHFRDEAYRGDDFSTRPAYKEMIKRAKTEVDLIATFSMSRIGRSLNHVVSVVCDMTQNHSTFFYFHAEKLLVDGRSAQGNLILAVYSGLNALSLEISRAAVKAGVEKKRREILENGGHWGRPYRSLDIGLMTRMRYEQKKSYAEIARRLQCGKSTVIRRLAEISKYHKPSETYEHDSSSELKQIHTQKPGPK